VTYQEGIVKNTEFFTTTELADKLKMNVQVITRKVQAGEIEAYKLGKDWRIPERSVYDWLENNSNLRKITLKKKTANMSTAKPKLVSAKSHESSRKYLLEYILAQFEPHKKYIESEVNSIIGRLHHDQIKIRKELINEKMIIQADGKYARCEDYQMSF